MKISEILEEINTLVFEIQDQSDDVDFEIVERVFISEDKTILLVTKFELGYEIINKLSENDKTKFFLDNESSGHFDYIDFMMFIKSEDNIIIACSLAEYIMSNTEYNTIEFNMIT